LAAGTVSGLALANELAESARDVSFLDGLAGDLAVAVVGMGAGHEKKRAIAVAPRAKIQRGTKSCRVSWGRSGEIRRRDAGWNAKQFTVGEAKAGKTIPPQRR
jgi:hypothetical protein